MDAIFIKLLKDYQKPSTLVNGLKNLKFICVYTLVLCLVHDTPKVKPVNNTMLITLEESAQMSQQTKYNDAPW